LRRHVEPHLPAAGAGEEGMVDRRLLSVEGDRDRLARVGVEQRGEVAGPRFAGRRGGQPFGGGVHEGHPAVHVRGDDGVLYLVQCGVQPVAGAGSGGEWHRVASPLGKLRKTSGEPLRLPKKDRGGCTFLACGAPPPPPPPPTPRPPAPPPAPPPPPPHRERGDKHS